MPHDPHQDLARLEDFLAEAAPALGLTTDDVPLADVLDLASEVARVVMRPGVPVTAYALGLAIGRGLPPARARFLLDEALTAFEAAHGPNPERRGAQRPSPAPAPR